MKLHPPHTLALLALLLVPLALAVALHSPSRSASEERDVILGRVSDRGGPLAAATVRFQGSPDSVRTDGAGRFRLPVWSNRSASRSSASTRSASRPHWDRVTAWKEGYLIAGAALDANPLRLTLRPLPGADNEAYEWVDPAADPKGTHNCANCHAEIYREWRGSGHARAATGGHFRDLYAGTGSRNPSNANWSLLDEHPLGAGVCAACHAPTVSVGDPAWDDLTRVKGVAGQGVHCDYCHKVAGEGTGTPGLTHGRYKLTLRRPAEGQLFFGPLDDVDRGEDVFSGFQKDSRFCAACHEGVVFGVHVYSTYSEWRESPAGRRGQHCQNCHMRPTGRLTNIAPGKGGIERDPWTLGNHRFFAGSQTDMLRQCLKVSARLTRREDGVRAEVSIRAEGVGHRVPTGFIDRHLILVAEGIGDDGKPVALRAGSRLPAVAGPALAGRPGRLYAKLLRDSHGRSPAPFWRAGVEPMDSRLQPGRTERLVFDFPAVVRRLRVRVLYRRFWQEVSKAKGWTDRDVLVMERVFRGPPP